MVEARNVPDRRTNRKQRTRAAPVRRWQGGRRNDPEERSCGYEVQTYLLSWFTIADDSGGTAILRQLDGCWSKGRYSTATTSSACGT